MYRGREYNTDYSEINKSHLSQKRQMAFEMRNSAVF